VTLIRARARQQGVNVEVEVPGEPVPVRADAGQIHTVLVNLLLNALDAMPRGGALQLSVAPAEGGRAAVRVRDTARAPPAEVAGRLFTPFATPKPTGTGLGLSLSKRIVEEHGGSIRAGAAAGGGTCFTVELALDGEVP